MSEILRNEKSIMMSDENMDNILLEIQSRIVNTSDKFEKKTLEFQRDVLNMIDGYYRGTDTSFGPAEMSAILEQSLYSMICSVFMNSSKKYTREELEERMDSTKKVLDHGWELNRKEFIETYMKMFGQKEGDQS